MKKYYYKFNVDGRCAEECKLTGAKIGSLFCSSCAHNLARGNESNWIKCEKIDDATGKGNKKNKALKKLVKEELKKLKWDRKGQFHWQIKSDLYKIDFDIVGVGGRYVYSHGEKVATFEKDGDAKEWVEWQIKKAIKKQLKN